VIMLLALSIRHSEVSNRLSAISNHY
jgi:hypothetical protein